MFQRVQMISTLHAFLKRQVGKMNKCAHTNINNVTSMTILNIVRRNAEINIPKQ